MKPLRAVAPARGAVSLALFACALVAAPTAARAAVTVEPGWPRAMGCPVSTSATAAELDTDPELEVVVASQDGRAYVFNHDGTLVPGWPRYMGSALWPDPWAILCSSPAVADLDGDGTPEIVIGCFDGRVHVFEPDGAPFGDWPFDAGAMVFSTPAVGDLDGDPELEIVFGAHDGNIYALNPDRSAVPGFPASTPYVVRSSPALADLDGDGLDEIVITADNASWQLYAIDGDGSALPGFPKYLWMSGAVSSPALGDLDRDGGYEIVAGSRNGMLHVLHAGGTYLPGWPVAAGNSIESSPALAELDGDPELEIVVGVDDSKVAAYNLDGTPLPGWPRPTAYSAVASPSIGDIDGDDDLEILCPDNAGDVNAWNVDGTVVPGFPLHDPTGTVYPGALLADLDLDGSLELLVGSNDARVYCWDLGPGTYHADALPWPEWRADAANRADVGVAPVASVASAGGRGLLARMVPNPFHGSARFELEATDAAGAAAGGGPATGSPGGRITRRALRIFDVGGREVRHFELDGAGAGSVWWDGRDAAGRDLPSGVYLYRIETGGRAAATGRAVLVR